MNFKKILSYGLAFIVTVVISSPIIFDQFIVPHYFSEWTTDRIAPQVKQTYVHLKEFKKDIEILKPKLVFLNSKKTSDAGPYLNPRISWNFSKKDSGPELKYNSQINKAETFSLDEKTTLAIQNFKSTTFEADSQAFSKVNTQWLHKLREFDYWDIDKNSPLDLYPRLSLTTPYPNFNLNHVKIHLIKNKDGSDEEFAEAILDALHYGELCLSTETLEGEMIFVATLSLAANASKLRHGLREKLGEWSNILEEKERLKRVYWGISQFARPVVGTNVVIMKEIFKEQSPPTGVCAAARDATGIDWPMWSALMDSSMEREFSEYKKLVMDNSVGCRLTWIKEKTPAWVKLPSEPESLYSSSETFKNFTSASGQESGNESFIPNAIASVFRLIHYMPNTRKLVATIFMTMSSPNYTRLYDEKKE